MIVFDLACAHGHVFEAWFGSSADFEAQGARGLVTCPVCGTPEVTKAVMAPAVAAKGNRRAPSLRAKLDEVRRDVEANCDYVGDRFAAEARAAHEGTRPRGVYGEASREEVKGLVDDGIPVAPLPFRPRRAADA